MHHCVLSQFHGVYHGEIVIVTIFFTPHPLLVLTFLGLVE